MNDLRTDHPSQPVRVAAANLLVALDAWRGNTGDSHLVIVRDAAGYQMRVLDGADIGAEVSDTQALLLFGK